MDKWFQLQRILRWLVVAALLNAFGWFLWWAIPRLGHLYRRVTNATPVAKLVLLSVNETNRTVVVSDGGSYDPDTRLGREDARIARWSILWGDGNSDAFTNAPDSVLHQYGTDGSYQINLACVDNFGASGSPAATNAEISFVTKLAQAAQGAERKAQQDRMVAQEAERQAEQDRRAAENAEKAAVAAKRTVEQAKNAVPVAVAVAGRAADVVSKAEQEAKDTKVNAEELERIAKLAEREAAEARQDANKKQQKVLNPPFLANRNRLKQDADQAAEKAKAANERAQQARSAADKALEEAKSKQRDADAAQRDADEKTRDTDKAKLEVKQAEDNLRLARDSASAAQKNAETAQDNAQQARKQAEDSQKVAELAKRDAQRAAEFAKQPVPRSVGGVMVGTPALAAFTGEVDIMNNTIPIPLLLSLDALVAVGIICLIALFLRCPIILASILQANPSAQEYLLTKYRKSKRFTAKLRKGLERKYHQARRHETRGSALQALLALARLEKDAERAGEILIRALKDDSPHIRGVAVNELSRKADDTAANLLESHLGSEQDPDLWRAALAGLLRFRWRQAMHLIRDENFNEAEALIRHLLALAPDDQALKAIQDRMPAVRQKAFEQKQATEQVKQRQSAEQIAGDAAQQLGNDNCDGAELLARKAIALDPLNRRARDIISELPQLRQRFDATLQAKNASEQARRIEELQSQASSSLDELDYDGAATSLLALASLAPDNLWAAQALEKLPSLQEQKRQANRENSLNKKLQRLEELRALLAECIEKEKYKEAAAHVRELLSIDPDNEETLRVAERVSILRDTSSALEDRVSRARKLYDTATADLEQTNYDKAAESLLQLAPLRPGDDWASQVLQSLPKLQEQKRAAEIQRTRNELLNRVSELHRLLTKDMTDKKFDAAEQHALELLALEPGNEEATKLCARAAELREADQRKSKSEDLWSKADSALKDSDWDKAERHLRSLLVPDGSKGRAQGLLNQLPDLRRQQEESEKLKTAAGKRAKTVALRDEINKDIKNEEFDSAVEKAKQVMTLVPTDAESSALLKRVEELKTAAGVREKVESLWKTIQSAMEKEDFDSVEAKVRSLLGVSPTEPRAQDLLNKLPDIREKSLGLHKAADHSKEQKDSVDALREAMKAFEKGNYSQAATKLRRAIALDPENRKASSLYKRVMEMDSLPTVPPSSTGETQLNRYLEIENSQE